MTPDGDHDAFTTFARDHPVGAEVRLPVVRVCEFGVFCRAADGVEAVLLVVDFAGGPRPQRFPDDYPRVGDVVGAFVCLIDPGRRKIRLSQRVDPLF